MAVHVWVSALLLGLPMLAGAAGPGARRSGSDTRIRTWDPLINSQLLYR